MSAWIVHKNHINAMVWFAKEHDMLGERTPDEFGQMLWLENHVSVNHRYNEDTVVPKFEYHDPVKQPSLPALAGIMGCYDYQTCEHDGYEDSDASKFVDVARVYSEVPSNKTLLPREYETIHGHDPDVNDGKGSDLPWGWEHD